MNLLLIGAGQLGSRHLQSCLKFQQKLKIYVVDNSISSLELSKERALEVENKANHKVHYLTDLTMIEESSFDYLIISTGASVRFNVLSDVLSLFIIKYAILEKVLFQDLLSYKESITLMKNCEVTAFVNCPLRVYPFFKEIKNRYISKNNKTSLKYTGGEWVGLACNSIHYLDLLSFLSDEKLQSITAENLDDGFINSKRPGNIEFTGTLYASYESGAHLSIEAIRGTEQDSIIEVKNGHYKILIDELSGTYKVFENKNLVENSSYDILYQSDLTHLMIDQISKTGDCELIKFDDSVIIHEELIIKLLGHYNNFSTEKTLTLPIT